jgi:hypothetical protein
MDGWKQVAEMALHYEHAKWRIRRIRWKYWKEGPMMTHRGEQRRRRRKRRRNIFYTVSKLTELREKLLANFMFV